MRFWILCLIFLTYGSFAIEIPSDLNQPFTYINEEGSKVEVEDPEVVLSAILEALTQTDLANSQYNSGLKVTTKDGRVIEVKDARAAIHQLWGTIIQRRDPNQPAYITITGPDGEEWILEDAGANFETLWKGLTTGGGDNTEYLKDLPRPAISPEEAEAMAEKAESIAEQSLQELGTMLELMERMNARE